MRGLVVLLMLAGALRSAPIEQQFQADCDTIWPHAMQVFLANGWGVKTSDRAGGVLVLEWQKGTSEAALGTVNALVGKYTTAKSKGFWTQYKAFRIDTANVVAVSTAGGCRYQLGITYQGWERRFWAGAAWWVLDSNGEFERKMLNEIQARLPGPAPSAAEEKKPESPAATKPAEPPANTAKPEAKPEPGAARPARPDPQSDTTVVRLPG